ncbi:MAG: glycosyltransferase [Bacillota bacterium]|jgi:adenine phosphoribosyltransferase|nr:glycosyltransferase [Clostridia bacterium]
MKILYLTQYFFTPEHAAGGRHYYHVKYLISQGHQVDVITTYVKDHMSRLIPKEYRGKLKVVEYYEGIRVYKTYASANYGQSFLDRMKNYLSFMFCAILVGLGIKGRYDVVFASSPSLFVGLAGYILSLFKRGKFVLEVRDLWPQSAVVLGFLKNPVFIFLAQKLEKFLYRKAKAIIALTQGIQDGICQVIRNKEKTSLIINGVDEDIFLKPEPEARGFILGSAVAYHLGAGFIPLRKAGKLPSFTHRIESVKEYGSDVFEANFINLDSTSKVLIIDDVLATGGTAKAAFNLVQGVNAIVMGFSFLLELVYLKGRESIPGHLQVNSLIQVKD